MSLKALYWGPFCRSLGSVITSPGFSYHCYTEDTLIATHISECMANISTSVQVLMLPGSPHMDFLVAVDDIAVSPSSTARNLGVVLDNHFCCIANITVVTRSCGFALYNICSIRQMRFEGKGHSRVTHSHIGLSRD